jgi:cytochrome P450
MTTAAAALASLDERLTAFYAGDPELTADPFPLYHELLERDPVHRFGEGSVLVTSHPLAKSVYRQPELFVTHRGRGRFADSVRLVSEHELDLLDEVTAFERMYMSSLNGEHHRRVRSAGQRALTPRRLEELRQVAQELTDDLLGRLAGDEVCDLYELCYKVPLLVIGDMLGAPRADADHLKELGDAVTAHKHFSPVPPEAVHRAHRGIADFRAYVHELIERNRADDKRTALAASLLDANEADRLTEDELAATMVLILFAGHETTTNLIGNGVVALMRFRDQWELLCADPSAAANAVEELLRRDGPVQGMGRVAAVDTELGGVAIPAGTRLRLINAAANRDPRVFEDPDGLDIRRRPIDHLALGHGLHFCLGGPLARIEGQVVFTTLARRFPDLELAVGLDEVEWNGDPQIRGVRRLPVRLGRDRGRAAAAAA